ncbi:BGTF surface domain-containing protein [Halopiger goleimassiliensis]|uniref:BGTF surface domain-containing protein n=1 Tax=Halopiger goleimassiliensis TaxID=1293048 RepID=UPI0009DBBBC9|nr:BGTF surface domain-containing protein [Halopiger goleimassiliensis]
MNDNTSYREKGRAVFLAAIMIVSVVAMSAAFTGAVAAQEDTFDVTDASITAGERTVVEADSQTQDIEVEFHIGQNIDSEEIAIDISDLDDVTDIDGDNVSVTVDTSSTGISATGASLQASDEELVISGIAGEHTDGASEGETITIQVTYNIDGDFEVDLGPETVQYTTNGESVSFNALSEQDIVFDSSDTTSDWAATTPSDITAGNTYDEDTVWEGVYVTTYTERVEDTVNIYEADEDDSNNYRLGDRVDRTGTTPGVATNYDTSNLEGGEEYIIELEGDTDDTYVAIELEELSLGAEAADTNVTTNNDIDVDVTSEDLTGSTVYGTVYTDSDLDDEADDFDTQTEELDANGDASFTWDLSEGNEGSYWVEVEHEPSDVTASTDEIEVNEAPDTEVEFRDNVRENIGNNASIVVEIEDHDGSVVVQVGDQDEENYAAFLEVTDEDDSGNVTIVHDTTAADKNAYSVVGDDELEVLNTPGVTNPPLEAGSYTLNVGLTGNSTAIDDRQDSAQYNLQDREELADDQISTHVAPVADSLSSSSDLEDTKVTADDTVAFLEEQAMDNLVVQLDNPHIYALLDEGDDEDALETNGFNLTIEEVNPGPNVQPSVWATDDGHENGGTKISVDTLVANQTEGQAVFALDNDDLADELEEGEEYYLNVTLDNHITDYAENASTTFETEEAELELDEDENANLANSSAEDVVGETNIAPGSELTIFAESDGYFFDDNETTVAEDGSFVGTFDFSEEPADIDVELSVEESQNNFGVSAEGDAVLYAADQPEPHSISLDATAPDSVEVGEDATLSVDVENVGEQTSPEFEFTATYDGDELASQSFDLEGGESESFEYELDTSAAGSFDWSVTADGEDVDASESGTLTVEEEEPSDEEPSDEDPSDEEPSDEEPSDEDEDDDDEEDGVPGFGFAVALFALIAAAMLALRQQE